MNNWGSTALYAVILLCGIVLVSVVAAEIINDTAGTTTEEDFNQMIDETIQEYSTYLDIDFKIGKYLDINGIQKVRKIALQISPLYSTDIDLTQLTIQLLNKDTVKLLNFSGVAEYYNGGSLFENINWDNITDENFGFLVTNDRDGSIVDFHHFNENSDRVYLIFRLSDDIALLKYDNLYVSIFPGTGITRTINLKAPMPIKSVVVFD